MEGDWGGRFLSAPDQSTSPSTTSTTFTTSRSSPFHRPLPPCQVVFVNVIISRNECSVFTVAN